VTKITQTYTMTVTGSALTAGDLQEFLDEVADGDAKIDISVDHGDQREPSQTTITAIVEARA